MISRTAEYALRAVLYLGALPPRTMASAADVAAATGVPERYLARVLNTLAHAGLLRSTRGARGGFRLDRAPDAMTLADTIAPFNPFGDVPRCLLRDQPCNAGDPCLAHAHWHDAASGVHAFFRRTTVADLLLNDAAGLAADALMTPLADEVTT